MLYINDNWISSLSFLFPWYFTRVKQLFDIYGRMAVEWNEHRWCHCYSSSGLVFADCCLCLVLVSFLFGVSKRLQKIRIVLEHIKTIKVQFSNLGPPIWWGTAIPLHHRGGHIILYKETNSFISRGVVFRQLLSPLILSTEHSLWTLNKNLTE